MISETEDNFRCPEFFEINFKRLDKAFPAQIPYETIVSQNPNNTFTLDVNAL